MGDGGSRGRRGTAYALCLLAALAGAGCFETRTAASDDADARDADAGDDPFVCPTGFCFSQHYAGGNATDLLFVIDDGPTMAPFQAHVRGWILRFAHALTRGELPNADGSVRTFYPLTSLHLGVVSADMGASGVADAASCPGVGDDGVLLHMPGRDALAQGCPAELPPFLRYREDLEDPEEVAADLACLGSLGSEGCALPQPLEAAFAALWPPPGFDADVPDRLPARAHGDGNGDGENAGFLRNDPDVERSLIGVVVVTNRDDCSTPDPAAVVMPDDLPPDLPTHPDLLLRCAWAGDRLHALERYLDGLRALRPGSDNLVVFGAIAGVPPELARVRDDQGNALVDLWDDTMRERWYAKILDDERMQIRIDRSDPDPQKHHLMPACSLQEDEGTDMDAGVADGEPGPGADAVAYPARRLVQLARSFEYGGAVASICDDDPTGILRHFAPGGYISGGRTCLDRPLTFDEEGRVDCELYWELPPADAAPEATPRRCDDLPFLMAPTGDTPRSTPSGGAVCVVPQLGSDRALRDAARVGDDAAKERAIRVGDGWFYDDFSVKVANECPPTTPWRISFTGRAMPKPGVTTRLVCNVP